MNTVPAELHPLTIAERCTADDVVRSEEGNSYTFAADIGRPGFVQYETAASADTEPAISPDISGFSRELAHNEDLRTIVSHLGFAAIFSLKGRRMGRFSYPSPQDLAETIAALNKKLPAEHQLMGIHPYDGDEMGAEEYISHIAADRLPVTTGRSDSVGRHSFFQRHFPRARLQAHDFLVHWLPHLASDPETRGQLSGFLQRVLARTDRHELSDIGPRGEHRTRVQTAADLVEYHWQVDEAFKQPPTPVFRKVGYGLQAIARKEYRPIPGDAETNRLVAKNRAHLAFVAGVIRSDFDLAA